MIMPHNFGSVLALLAVLLTNSQVEVQISKPYFGTRKKQQDTSARLRAGMEGDLEVALGAEAGEAGGAPHGEGVGHTQRLLHRHLVQRRPLPAL